MFAVVPVLTVTETLRSAAPASLVSMSSSVGSDAGMPLPDTPAPDTLTRLGSTDGFTRVRYGLKGGSNRHQVWSVYVIIVIIRLRVI